MKTILALLLTCLTAFGAGKKTTDYPPITNAGPNDLLLLSEITGSATNSKSLKITNLNNSLLALSRNGPYVVTNNGAAEWLNIYYGLVFDTVSGAVVFNSAGGDSWSFLAQQGTSVVARLGVMTNAINAAVLNRLTNNQTGVTLDGTFSGNGAGLTSLSGVILSDTGKGTNTTLSQGIIFDFLTFGSGIYFTNTAEALKWTLTSTGTNALPTLGQVSNIVAAATNGLTAGGGSGDTNSFYVLTVATNLLPNAVVVSSILDGFKELQIQSCILPTNAAPGLDTGSNYTYRLLFDDTANEAAYWSFVLPVDYGTNAILVCSYSMLTGAATRTNVFNAQTHHISMTSSNNVNVDNWATMRLVTNVIPIITGWEKNFFINLGLAANPYDRVRLKLNREATNTMDSASSGDVALHSIAIRYTKR